MARNRSDSPPTVTFWGAARTVTGSMHRLDAAGKTVLVDCGFFQGRRSESHARNRDFPFRPKDIDAVLLTHAHIDHCGNLPNLVKQGFKGPIYCTDATRALTAVMLGDAAKIQEEDANYLNRKRERGEPKVEPIYDARDVYRTLLRLKAVPYDEPVEVFPGLDATYVEAGHLLGSAMIAVRVGEKRITFTGDVGRPGTPILRDPAPVPPADLIVSESTYGGHTHEPVEETADKLGEVVRHTAARGGKVLIPAFSVGRTQTVVYFLHQLIEAGKLSDVPIFVDSPMANRATEVFRSHSECFDKEALGLLDEHPELFGEQHVRYVETVNESIALNKMPGPAVVISASGMCEAGRILHHLKHNLGDPRNTVLIVGYQADNTLGRRLVERQPEVRVLGRTVPVKAEIVVLNGLSAHADHGELVAMLAPHAATAKAVRLVHGEPDRAEALATGLREAGFADVGIPDRGESVTATAPTPPPPAPAGDRTPPSRRSPSPRPPGTASPAGTGRSRSAPRASPPGR
ncbi:MAG TPA: MBL fold metallo-hydrolase [Fimbriiglobus sp.]|nr:MBL fold metallo-hydrolase [Fimbriiglobus sp.]